MVSVIPDESDAVNIQICVVGCNRAASTVCPVIRDKSLSDGEVLQIPGNAARIEDVYVANAVLIAVTADGNALAEAINRHVAVDARQSALEKNRAADAKSDRVRPAPRGTVAAGRVAVRIRIIDRLAQRALPIACRCVIAQVVDDDGGERFGLFSF